MRHMKKFFALAIAVVMAMSLVACSSSTSSSSETAGSNQSSQPETVTIKSLNANGEEVDLVVPYCNFGYGIFRYFGCFGSW